MFFFCREWKKAKLNYSGQLRFIMWIQKCSGIDDSNISIKKKSHQNCPSQVLDSDCNYCFPGFFHGYLLPSLFVSTQTQKNVFNGGVITPVALLPPPTNWDGGFSGAANCWAHTGGWLQARILYTLRTHSRRSYCLPSGPLYSQPDMLPMATVTSPREWNSEKEERHINQDF